MADATALLNQANRLLREGRGSEAIAAFKAVLAARPDLPDPWFNLAYLQRQARDFEAALASYGEALARGVAGPEEAHVNRAAILSEFLDRTDEAEAELKAAVAANPRFVVAWLNLGNLYEDLGEVGQARAAYERALEVAPGHGRALARLTAIDAFEGAAKARVAALEDALRRPGLSHDDAAEIGFALGNALDAIGDYDAAFRHYDSANRLVRERLGARGRYDPEAHERLVDAIIASPVPAPVAGDDGEAPIFICGMFRSGSTLAEHILGRHSRVTAGGEIDVIPALVGAELQPYPKALAEASAEKLARLRDAYHAHVRKLHPDAERITDKRPDNFLHIGLIKALFPRAKIVHTVRAPLDNILSVFFLYFDDSVRYGWRLDSIAHWFGQYRRLMAHWTSLYGDDILDLPYDELVGEPGPVLERLQDFLGLEREDLLEDRGKQSAVRTPSAWQVRRPLHGRSSGRWRNYAAHLGGIREMVEKL